jgi:hypothetical protein
VQESVVAGLISAGSEFKSPTPPPIVASQDFLLALTDPSIQMKVEPWQWSIPPFAPLHGVFA